MTSSSDRSRFNVTSLRRACRHCSLRELCLPMGLNSDDIKRLEGIVNTKGPMDRGAHLFREGDRFRSIYAVREGAIKTYSFDSDGREHVHGFHLPGELVGLDAIYPRVNRCNAMALEKTTVCILPFARLADLAQEVPGLQNQVLRLMSKDLSLTSDRATDHTAEEKLAGFLLSLSARMGGNDTLVLMMPRRDIARYLRLATETISRLFARFQKNKLIKVKRRTVKLLDTDGLKDVCGAYEMDMGGQVRGDTGRQ
ncbi:MAG: cyclic nucleotide-binding domain-containing protein [Gammaproteobacteria bacterium]